VREVRSTYAAAAGADGPTGLPVAGEGPGPHYTVSAVARRLGVAPATLRTWARRYGLGPSEHTSGAHRRYSATDLARLQRMRRLTLEGVAPADAARLAIATEPEEVADAAVLVPDAGVDAEPDGLLGGDARTGGPGGRVLAVRSGGPAARGLARAVLALDDEAVTSLLRAHLARDGVVVTWEQVLAPVLVAVGQRWAATGEGVDGEHLLSECAAAALREVASAARAEGQRRPALLACAENDLHSLPLHALAAGLAEEGVAARVLGAAMPTPALVSAVRRTGPVALFLWSQVSATASREGLDALPVLRPPVSVVVGGPGWRVIELPPRVAHAGSLAEAVELVAAATGR
jgi:DNA-binding transcriptional MerR regulator